MVWQVNHGERGMSWLDQAWRGAVGQTYIGRAWYGALRHGSAGLGKVWR